jgi:hypothetical protein
LGVFGFLVSFFLVLVTFEVTFETVLLPAPSRSRPLGPVGPVKPDDPPFCLLPPLPPDDPEWPEPPDDCGVLGVVAVVVVVGVVPVEVGVVGAGAVTVADGVVDVDVEGVQLAETSVSPGGTSDTGGVPGAALTVIVGVPPVGSATTSVHVSAEAFAIAAIAIVARTALTVMATIFSLRLFDTLL